MAKKTPASSSSSSSTSASKRGPTTGHRPPPPLDKWILPAVGVAVAMVGYHFMRGMMQREIVRVNLDDELELREVFFGEDTGLHNYAVLCHPENAKYPISSVFHDAAQQGGNTAVPPDTLFRVMDCDHVLTSSEKTVKERFNLNDKTRPLVFVSGKMGPPRQVPSKHLKTGGMLSKALKNLLTPKAEKIETTQDLRTKCLDKPICALLLKGSKQSPNYVKDAMAKLLVEYPKVAFGAVDTSVLYVKGLEAEYLPAFEKDVPRFAVFEKVAGSADKKNMDAERLKTSVVSLPKGGVAYGPMSNLIASVVQKSSTMTKVSTLPTVKTRTKKLEQEEQQKRTRREEQQRRKDGGGGGSGSGGGGAFSGNMDNDGTSDGRRAERERRREEHRKSNPNYKEKTPEEIAEIERQRRVRMEEEAKKWNVAPEDMPEEGAFGTAGGDGDYYMDEDWGDAMDDEASGAGSGDGGENEDDDVMDLD